MGLSKRDSFDVRQNRIADLAKALGHPARIAILQFLANQSACMCGDIVEELPLSQATVSQHLAELNASDSSKGRSTVQKSVTASTRRPGPKRRNCCLSFWLDVKKCC